MTLAYLDPASGSLIASALVGGVAAAGVAAKQARMRLTGGFGRKRKQEPEFSEDTTTDDAPVAESTDDGGVTVDADAADRSADKADKTAPVGSDS